METLSEKERENEVKKFDRKVKRITQNSNVNCDVSAQEKYIVEKKRNILQFNYCIRVFYNAVEKGQYTSFIPIVERNAILRALSKITCKLSHIDYSLEEEYKTSILAHQWIERNKNCW